jgi:hypothetical protein
MESNNKRFNDEVNIGGPSYFDIKTSTVVKLKEHLSATTTDGVIDLEINITADFNNIPEKYHEIFLNMMTSKYLNKVNFGQNPFSECKPIIKRKWWQFWKTKYFMT